MTTASAAARSRGNLVADLIAGLTTRVANIPDAMASANLAGINPLQGLYAIMIGTPLGALLGSSAFMNVAATSALAITAGAAIAGYSEDVRANAIATLAVLTGPVMLVAGLLKLGRLLRFVSNSVVIGFLTGVSINAILSQLGDFTGHSSAYSNKVVKAILAAAPGSNRPPDDGHRPADGGHHPLQQAVFLGVLLSILAYACHGAFLVWFGLVFATLPYQQVSPVLNFHQ